MTTVVPRDAIHRDGRDTRSGTREATEQLHIEGPTRSEGLGQRRRQSFAALKQFGPALGIVDGQAKAQTGAGRENASQIMAAMVTA